MPLGKEFTKTISFSCSQEVLKKAIHESIQMLNLKPKENNLTEEEIYYLLAEKMKWMSTN